MFSGWSCTAIASEVIAHPNPCLSFPKCEMGTVETPAPGCDLVEGRQPLRLQAAPTQCKEVRARGWATESELWHQSKESVGAWDWAGRLGRTSGLGGAEEREGREQQREEGGDWLEDPRGIVRAPAMGSVARLAALLAALLAVLALRAADPAGAVAGGDTFSALTSVARALAPERRLLALLRRYLRGEEARLRDLTR